MCRNEEKLRLADAIFENRITPLFSPIQIDELARRGLPVLFLIGNTPAVNDPP